MTKKKNKFTNNCSSPSFYNIHIYWPHNAHSKRNNNNFYINEKKIKIIFYIIKMESRIYYFD